MFKISDNNIYIIRGDSAYFKLDILDARKRKYTLKDTDKVILTVKKNTKSKEILIQKNLEESIFRFEPKDTQNLDYGRFVYDVQFTSLEGYVDTIISPHTFQILEEVTF